MNNRLVLRIDVLSNRELLILGVVACSLMVAYLVIGVTGPSSSKNAVNYAYDCPKNSHQWSPDCDGVRLGLPGVVWTHSYGKFTLLNQYWALAAWPYNILYQSDGVNDEKLPTRVLIEGSNNKKSWHQVANKTTTLNLHCHKGEQRCEGWWVAIESYLNYEYYKLSVEFLQSNAKSYVGDVRFRMQWGNDQYNNLRLGFHVTWLGISVGVAVALIWKLRNRSFNQWVFEQKCLMVLLLALCAYNDPFFPFTFLVDHWIFAFFGSFLEMIWQGVIVLLWLIYVDLYRRGIENGNDWEPLTWYELPKYVAVICYSIFTLVFYTWVRVEGYDENVPGDEVPDGIVALFYLSAISFAILIVWVIVLCTVSVSQAARKPHLFKRYVYFICPSAVCIFAILTSLFSGSLGPYNRTLLQFIFFFGMWNTYVWYLCYGWWPYSGDSFSLPNATEPDETSHILIDNQQDDASFDPLAEPEPDVDANSITAISSSSSASSSPSSSSSSSSSQKTAKITYGTTTTPLQTSALPDEPWAHLPTDDPEAGL